MKKTVTAYTNCIGRKTDKAVQIFVEGELTIWIPRSILIKGTKRTWKGSDVTEYAFTLPYWFASQEGLTVTDGWGIPKYPIDINIEEAD